MVKPLILVVDDDPVVRHIIGSMLQPEKFEVVFASSGENCREQVELMRKEDRAPRVIFLDYMLGDANGLELAAEIRAHVPWSSIPVILLSAVSKLEVGNLSQKFKADYYLEKPFRADDLLEVLDKALER